MDTIPGSVHLRADHVTSVCTLGPQGQLLLCVAGVHIGVPRPLAVLGELGWEGCRQGTSCLGVAIFWCLTPRRPGILTLKLAFPVVTELHLWRQEVRMFYLVLCQLGLRVVRCTFPSVLLPRPENVRREPGESPHTCRGRGSVCWPDVGSCHLKRLTL